MQVVFLGDIFRKKKWCITVNINTGINMPFLYIFTKGTFEKGSLTYKEIMDVVTISILSSGIKKAVTEEIVFRGMILKIASEYFWKEMYSVCFKFFIRCLSF